MATELRFGPLPIRSLDLLAPRVYAKARWEDEWIDMLYVAAEEAVWCCGPSIPTATLRFDYGYMRQLGSLLGKMAGFDPTDISALTTIPAYVKIVWFCERDPAVAVGSDPVSEFIHRTWYGVTEIRTDMLLGVGSRETRGRDGRPIVELDAAGTVLITCYGFEQLLAREPIRQSFFDRGNGITSNNSAIAFNSRGKPNASKADYDGAPVHWYDPSDTANCDPWSTRTIVKHLLRRHSPKDSLGVRKLVFACPDAAKLPDWDEPVLETDGQTVLGLIQRLVSRQRLYQYWFEVSEDESSIDMRVETLTPNAVPLAAKPGAEIPAVTKQIHAIYCRDPATSATLRDSGLQQYDVVHVRGAPLLYVGTFSWADGTLRKAWTDDAEIDYEEGASRQSGYGAASLDEKQKRNIAARSSPLLEDVFSRFEIAPDWSQRVGDGIGGATTPLFVGDAGQVPVYWPDATIETGLPLFPDVDYARDRITTGLAAAEELTIQHDIERRPVLACFRRGVADADGNRRWFRAEDMGKLAGLPGVDPEDADRITVHVHVPHDSHSVVLRVSGGDQHAICPTLFTPLTADAKHDEWSIVDGLTITLAMPSGERVEGRAPAFDPGGVDYVRRLIVEAGGQYERVYVAPNTVVGVTPNGELDRSTGGWIERPANVRQILADIAQVAAAWYTIPHKSVTITTARMMSAELIEVGDMIAKIGDDAIADNPHVADINAPISQIRFAWPTLESGSDKAAPSMTIETFAGELDPMAIGPGALQGNVFRTRRAIDL